MLKKILRKYANSLLWYVPWNKINHLRVLRIMSELLPSSFKSGSKMYIFSEVLEELEMSVSWECCRVEWQRYSQVVSEL